MPVAVGLAVAVFVHSIATDSDFSVGCFAAVFGRFYPAVPARFDFAAACFAVDFVVDFAVGFVAVDFVAVVVPNTFC